jgi:hypothetical protein
MSQMLSAGPKTRQSKDPSVDNQPTLPACALPSEEKMYREFHMWSWISYLVRVEKPP